MPSISMTLNYRTYIAYAVLVRDLFKREHDDRPVKPNQVE
jgi:hypothetical protein